MLCCLGQHGPRDYAYSLSLSGSTLVSPPMPQQTPFFLPPTPCMHMCGCVCAFLQMCEHMQMHTCGGQRLMLGLDLNCYPLYLLTQGLSLNL